jgi:hypothetical protein
MLAKSLFLESFRHLVTSNSSGKNLLKYIETWINNIQNAGCLIHVLVIVKIIALIILCFI